MIVRISFHKEKDFILLFNTQLSCQLCKSTQKQYLASQQFINRMVWLNQDLTTQLRTLVPCKTKVNDKMLAVSLKNITI